MNVPEADSKLCRAGCGMRIVLAVTGQVRKRGRDAQGRAQVEEKYTPIDAEPSEQGGNYTLAKVGDQYHATKITRMAQLDGLRAAGQRLHTSHGKTCPNLDKWLRENRGKRL